MRKRMHDLKTRLLLRIWWEARKRAVLRIEEDRPVQYRDARMAWAAGARLTEPLNTPGWNVRGLRDDLALHDAADYMLGEYA